jgi:hypothetical protein
MSDTSPEIAARYRAMVLARPPGGARFKIASDMFDITRGLLIAGIRAARPDITEGELRQELFLRYYGDEFSPEQRERILAAIEAYWARRHGVRQADVPIESADAGVAPEGGLPDS